MSNPRHLEAREAELSVLGGILLDNSAIDRVANVVRPEDFFAGRHQRIAEEMFALNAAREPIDAVTLAAALDQAGALEEVGGVDYLIELSQASATALNIEHHARIVRENSDVRRLIRACAEITDRAQRGDYEDVTELFDAAQRAVYELAARRESRGFVHLKSALTESINKIKKAYESKEPVTGLPTGFFGLDRITAGFHPGDLLILAARPAMGKTALALNLAVNAAQLGQKTVAVFSLEMPTVQLATRMLASDARVNGERMKTGHLAQEDILQLVEASKRLSGLSVFIDDSPGLTVMECRSKCRRLASDEKLPPFGLVIIDYLQLMHGRASTQSREQVISEISRNLKELAKELSIPVIALSQLNRGVESRPNKRPLLSDLRESGAIEQDADVIMFVYRDEYYNPETEDKGVAELIIGKHRSGSTGTVKLKFFNEWTRFDNLANEQ